jgi:hypothetical protein
MAGKVFTFNIFSEEMNLYSVNGIQTSPIPGWSDGKNSPLYTPAGLAVDRVVNTSAGFFSNGGNRVILQWPSGIFTFTPNIDGMKYPVSQNLVLTIMLGRWQFIDSSGYVFDEGILKPGTTALLQEVMFREVKS